MAYGHRQHRQLAGRSVGQVKHSGPSAVRTTAGGTDGAAERYSPGLAPAKRRLAGVQALSNAAADRRSAGADRPGWQGSQNAGVFLEIGSDEFFDHTGR